MPPPTSLTFPTGKRRRRTVCSARSWAAVSDFRAPRSCRRHACRVSRRLRVLAGAFLEYPAASDWPQARFRSSSPPPGSRGSDARFSCRPPSARERASRFSCRGRRARGRALRFSSHRPPTRERAYRFFPRSRRARGWACRFSWRALWRLLCQGRCAGDEARSILRAEDRPADAGEKALQAFGGATRFGRDRQGRSRLGSAAVRRRVRPAYGAWLRRLFGRFFNGLAFVANRSVVELAKHHRLPVVERARRPFAGECREQLFGLRRDDHAVFGLTLEEALLDQGAKPFFCLTGCCLTGCHPSRTPRLVPL